MMDIKKVGIVGLGAMGSVYAYHILSKNTEIELYGIVKNISQYSTLTINDKKIEVNCIDYSYEPDKAFDLIFIMVKSYQLSDVILNLAPFVGEDTIIMSFLNGVSSEQKLAAAFGPEKIIYSTIISADTFREGAKVIFNKLGTVYFGEQNGIRSQNIKRLEYFFGSCKIDYKYCDSITLQLWRKLLINVGCNQVSTLFQLPYGEMRKDKNALKVMEDAQKEVVLIANHLGINISVEDIEIWKKELAVLSSKGRSSMLQDFWAGRDLELDIMGKYICDMGKTIGIQTPINNMLVIELEKMVVERNNRNNKQKINDPKELAKVIRLEIIGQSYKTGDKLSENVLTKRFGTNRSVVRAALQILVSDGLVITLENGRREVAEFSARQIQDLYNFRWLIEKQAVDILIKDSKRKNTIFPLITNVLMEIANYDNQDSTDIGWFEFDIKFHYALVASTGNLFLTNAWSSNANLFYALMVFNSSKGYIEAYTSEFYEKHRKLYEMLLTDSTSCIEELKKHIIDAEVIANTVMEVIKLKKE